MKNAQIHAGIQAYYGGMNGAHHRYHSWEHCYRYFHRSPEHVVGDHDYAALQLAFYLASWGMYRGSSFLLQHDYTIHLAVIDRLVAPQFCDLREKEFGAGNNDSELVPIILDAVAAIRQAYSPFNPSDTLVTKVLLGTFGCLPACDRYFKDGFKRTGFQYSHLNAAFIERVLWFCKANFVALREEQQRIETVGGMRYPLMKLIDMYFWQIGYTQSGIA
jgi:hypothetical protein